MTQHTSGRLTVSLNTANVTVTADDSLIVHGRVAVFPCEKNRPGYSEADYVPHDHQLEPGDAAVSFREAVAADHHERLALFGGASGRSRHAEAMAIVSVPWPKQDEPVFRPPAIGRADNPIVAFFRNNPIPLSKIRWNKLTRLALLPPGKATEVAKRLLPRFQRFCGDIWSGWRTDDRTPDLQHAGYGSYYAGDVSQLLTVIMDKDLDEQLRRALTIAAIQRGIDYLGAFADGRQNWMVDGGHMWGRWPLVVFAGHMLDIPQAINPDSVLAARLVENQAFNTANPAWWNGLDVGWRRGWSDQPFLWKRPDEWSAYDKWAFTGYFPHVMGAHVGIVLFLRMADLWTPGMLCSAVANWMQYLDDHDETDLNLADCGSVVNAWGTSYAATGDSDLCAQAWRARYSPA